MEKKRIIKKTTNCLNGCKGFSLAEVLVTVVIFSVLMAAVNTILLVGDSSWQTNRVQVELQQDLRKAMDWMKDDLRQTGSSAIDDVPADGEWYTSITFQMVTGVTGGTLTWNSNTTQFVLGGTDSNQLQRIEDSTTKVIAQNIESLEFRRLAAAPDIIEVALEAEKDTVKGVTITSTLDFEIQLRN
jgi:prepilin-type N-terminal cleavage/methylation domain-containing protein